jgi:hypothetical protein
MILEQWLQRTDQATAAGLTVVPPSVRQGTLPLGDIFLNLSHAGTSPKRRRCSVKGTASSRIKSHGRSDQDE